MNPRAQNVQAEAGYLLRLTSANGEVRHFDVKHCLNTGIFRELRQLELFNSVRPFLGSIQWQNGQDLCPDMLYEQSVPAIPRSRRPLPVAEPKGRYPARRKK